MSILDDLYAKLDAALEEADITQEDYKAVRRDMKLNALDERQVWLVLGWLEAGKKWPDAMLAYPDLVLEEIREQNELDRRPEYNNTTKGLPMFSKKGVYHSEFVKAGAVRIMITSDLLESKFKKGEHFVAFKTEDGSEHTYTIENDGIRATVEALPKNTWLTVHASGSRDTASITVDEAPTLGEIKQAAKPQAKPTVSTNIAPQPAIADSYWDALEAARGVVEAYKEKYGEEPGEAVRTIATGFQIEKNHNPQRQLVA